jgi:hypothetical protein
VHHFDVVLPDRLGDLSHDSRIVTTRAGAEGEGRKPKRLQPPMGFGGAAHRGEDKVYVLVGEELKYWNAEPLRLIVLDKGEDARTLHCHRCTVPAELT